MSSNSAERPSVEPPDSRVVLADGYEGTILDRLDDTEIPAELLGPPRNDAPRSPVERASYWVRLVRNVKWGVVHRYLVSVKGSADDVADDLTNMAFMRAMGLDAWPSDDTKLKPFVKGCARHVFKEHYRADFRFRKHVENSEDIEQHGSEESPADENLKERLERFHAIAKKLIEKNPSYGPVYQLLLRMAETGESIEQAAAALGMTPGQARKRIQRFWAAVRAMNERLEKVSSKAGTAATVVFAMILLYIAFQRRPVPTTGPVRLPTPPGSTAPLSVQTNPTPRELRARGLALCANGRYVPCIKQLDRAKVVDPEGDKDPAVVEARKGAEKAMHGTETPKRP
jgi:DNA-directed RNA polymerase specialized sigma24 family protein